ncbi:MAG: peptidylprolyl isomerase [Desulfovibrio sp.]|nr:MAG: peptidylprolyl isomerase [Desulfovibrio sp.]
MSEITSGSQVSLHYTGTLDDGTVFDTSQDKEPLNFTVGQGQVIPGFENAVMGMNEGEDKEFTVPPEEGYGQQRDEMLLKAAKDELPEGVQVGSVLRSSVNGQEMFFSVVEADGDDFILDGNHPLAGKSLTFAITIVKVS